MRHPVSLLALGCLCQLALVGAAAAQNVNVTLADPPTAPAQPTSDLPVSARVNILACDDIPIVPVRNGQIIDLHYQNRNCPIIPIESEATVPLGNLFQGTYLLRVVETSDPANPRIDDEANFVVTPVTCPSHPFSPQIQQLCLRGGRFSVFASWDTGPTGFAKPIKLSSDSGAMWFFTADNVELMVKVLDACHYNGRFWFFAAGLTDLPVFITVRDNQTGAQRTYQNPAGVPFRAITDTSAFACQ